MHIVRTALLLVACLAAARLLHAGDGGTGPAFEPLFNGRDLSGWVNVNTAPDTWSVRDGMIVCTGKPNGFLRTERPWSNFVLELEWNHRDPAGNAGLFIWAEPDAAQGVPFPKSIEVQVMLTPDKLDDKGRTLYTGQGDIFSIHGATCVPDRPHPAGWQRCLPEGRFTRGAGEWNHYRIEARDGRLTLAVNGHVVSGIHDASPRRGFICLEAEGTEIWYRNIRIQPLPDSPPSAAPPPLPPPEGQGWVPLYDGRSLSGWKGDGEAAAHWTPRGPVLDYDGRGTHLWSTTPLQDFQLSCDWRWTGPHQGVMPRPRFGPDGMDAKRPDGGPDVVMVEERDSGIYLRGSDKSQVNIWCWPCGSGEVWGYRTDAGQPAEVRRACAPSRNADRPVGEWNRFLITMKGDVLTVQLNGTIVIDGARLPGVPAAGPIALQSHGSPIQFANVLVRPLP